MFYDHVCNYHCNDVTSFKLLISMPCNFLMRSIHVNVSYIFAASYKRLKYYAQFIFSNLQQIESKIRIF